MSILSWDDTQDSKLFDEPFSEETIIDNVNLKFTPSNATFVVLSTTLPYTPEELTDKSEKVNNGVIISDIKVPKVLEDTKFYISCRISLNGEKLDKYFYIEAKNEETSWDIDQTRIEKAVYDDIDIQLKLKNANGDEVFKKISGTLPANVHLSESGKLYGMITENDSDTEFVFTIGVFRNGKLIDTEALEPLDFTINVSSKSVDTSPYWITEAGGLGEVSTGNTVRMSVYAYSPLKHKLTYYITDELSSNEYDILPGLHFQRDTGLITGTPLTKQTKSWHFSVYAKDESIERQTSTRTFWINSNPVSPELKLHWYQNGKKLPDDIEYVNLGSYKIGEAFSGQVVAKAEDSDLPITYVVTVGEPPEGFVLYPNGDYAGSYGGELDFQKTKTYSFKIQATNGQDTIETEFRITAEANLGYNAVNACLRLNLDNLAEYDDIKAQLKVDENYKGFNKKYRTGSLPKIDICKLSCFDKILLSAMLEDYGNAEKITFKKTEQKNFCDGLDDYDVFYKTLDEDTFQWTNVPNGSYNYDDALDVLKKDDEDYKNAELEWNVPGKYISTLEPTEEMILSSYAGMNYYTENMEMKTITFVVTPADSDILLECNGYNMVREGNTASITVPRGAVVRYRVSHDEYISNPSDDLPMGIIEAKGNITRTIILMRESTNSLTVSCTDPSNDYIVYFDTQKLEEDYPNMPYIIEDGYTTGERTIYVPDHFVIGGVEQQIAVTYTVSADGYKSKTNREIIREPTQQNVLSLEKENYTLTFEVLDNISGDNITHDCDITITAGDTTITGTSITVPYKTVVTVSVFHVDYGTMITKYIATSTSYNIIRLTPQEKVNIKVTNASLVSDISIIAIVGDKTYEGINELEFYADFGSNVSYTASGDHYVTQSKTLVNVTSDTVEEVSMVLKPYLITINPTPSDSYVKLWIDEYGEETAVEGTGQQSLYARYGQTYRWEVSKTGWTSNEGSGICTGENTEEIELSINYYTLTLNILQEQPEYGNVDQPTVIISATGYTQEGNTITVPYGTKINWSVSCKHYMSKYGLIGGIEDNITEDVELKLNNISFTVKSKYENISEPASITLIDGEEYSAGYSETSILGKWGDVIEYSMYKKHFNQYKPNGIVSGIYNLIPEDDSNIIIEPDMDIDYYKTIINYDSSICGLSLVASDGTAPVNNTITTKYGTTVTYKVYLISDNTKYITETITPESSKTYTIVLDEITEFVWRKEVGDNYTIDIPFDGIYYMDIVGAGGGGKADAFPYAGYWWSSAGSGGSGAYIHGYRFVNKGSYAVKVGIGGKCGGTNGTSYPGSESSILGEIAGGGAKGVAGAGGAGGTYTASSTMIGVSGNTGATGDLNVGAVSTGRTITPYDGTNTGPGSGSGSGGADGSNGLVYVKYISPKNLEFTNPGIYKFSVTKKTRFDLTMIGAGGGGCGNGYTSSTSSGCSGAGGGAITGTLDLNPDTYTVEVGQGGYGTGGSKYKGDAGGSGTETTIKDSNNNIIAYCQGGTGGRAWTTGSPIHKRAHVKLGVGGSSSYNGSYLSNVTQYTGSNGTGDIQDGVMFYCPETITGNSYGVGGSGAGYSEGNQFVGNDGNSGYFKITWISSNI